MLMKRSNAYRGVFSHANYARLAGSVGGVQFGRMVDLKAIAARLGMKKKALADFADVHINTLDPPRPKGGGDKPGPTPATLLKIARALEEKGGAMAEEGRKIRDEAEQMLAAMGPDRERRERSDKGTTRGPRKQRGGQP